LGLPESWLTASQAQKDALRGGVLVYGAASAVGAFAMKLLTRANIHPIIAIAGRGIPFVEGLIDKSKGDVVIDYREGGEKIVEHIRSVIPTGQKLLYAFDAVSEGSSCKHIAEVLDPCGHITFVLPGEYKEIPSTANKTITLVGGGPWESNCRDHRRRRLR
jgi:NADPH:quinone reductase-like Zn-dependent oxidoreductase